MHLDDERIQRLLHGELDAPAKEAAAHHAAECALCAQRIEDARREEEIVLEALRGADHPAPAVSAEMIAARARGAAIAERTAQRDVRDHRGLLLRRAAAVLITIAVAGTAYAVPGSPLPALLDRIVALLADSPPPSTPDAPARGDLSAPSHDLPVTSGIAIAPRERFVIRFAAAQERGVVAVTLTDGSNIAVRVVGGAATFGTEMERLRIENEGSTADYEIEVPRSAPWVAIEIGSRRVVLKEGSRFETDAAADPSGRYLFSLAR